MRFIAGQRVIVTNYPFHGLGCQKLNGYYGHVVDCRTTPVGRFVIVNLEGRVNDSSNPGYIGSPPFPFYENELEHAD